MKSQPTKAELKERRRNYDGFQLWVNLPSALKMTPPRYQDIRAGQVALLSSADGGALLRVIAGSFGGPVAGGSGGVVPPGQHIGPGITHTPITLVHATVAAGAQVRLPWRADFNALGYVLAGRGTVGAEKRPVQMGQLATFGAGDAVMSRRTRNGTWTSCCSAGSRSGSRSPRTGRS